MELKSSWECHRCKQVNAPHIDHCSCQPNAQPFTGSPHFLPVQPYQYPNTVPAFPWPYSTIICGDGPHGVTGPSTSIPGTVSGAGYALGSLSDNVARFVDGKPV
jgi:hypothetical protein